MIVFAQYAYDNCLCVNKQMNKIKLSKSNGIGEDLLQRKGVETILIIKQSRKKNAVWKIVLCH